MTFLRRPLALILKNWLLSEPQPQYQTPKETIKAQKKIQNPEEEEINAYLDEINKTVYRSSLRYLFVNTFGFIHMHKSSTTELQRESLQIICRPFPSSLFEINILNRNKSISNAITMLLREEKKLRTWTRPKCDTSCEMKSWIFKEIIMSHHAASILLSPNA